MWRHISSLINSSYNQLKFELFIIFPHKTAIHIDIPSACLSKVSSGEYISIFSLVTLTTV